MKDMTYKKEPGDKHPVREYLSLTYARWLEINGIIERTITSSLTWGQVLTGLSKNSDLNGVEFVLVEQSSPRIGSARSVRSRTVPGFRGASVRPLVRQM